MTATILATTEQAAAERQAASNRHVFTLTFPGGQIAVLEVRGAADQEAASAIAQQAVRQRRTISQSGEQVETPINYTVADGDATRGRAELFYYWCSAAAQERQPLHTHHHQEAQA
jgi:hypothetical protein